MENKPKLTSQEMEIKRQEAETLKWARRKARWDKFKQDNSKMLSGLKLN
jgi:hypothetical protein